MRRRTNLCGAYTRNVSFVLKQMLSFHRPPRPPTQHGRARERDSLVPGRRDPWAADGKGEARHSAAQNTNGDADSAPQL